MQYPSHNTLELNSAQPGEGTMWLLESITAFQIQIPHGLAARGKLETFSIFGIAVKVSSSEL